jgi:hypothetical protein
MKGLAVGAFAAFLGRDFLEGLQLAIFGAEGQR